MLYTGCYDERAVWYMLYCILYALNLCIFNLHMLRDHVSHMNTAKCQK